MRLIVSRVAVAVLVLYALVRVSFAAAPFWEPAGTLGFQTDYGATVRAVAADGPAARAGIVPGDRLELRAVAIGQRRYLAGAGVGVPPGVSFEVPYRHAGRLQTVRLTAVPVLMSPADRFALLLQCLASLAFIVVGAGLIWLRPGIATWSFGLYCLLVLPSDAYPVRLASTFWSLASTFVYDIAQNAGVGGLLIFALTFPRPFSGIWRTRIRRAIPAGAAVLAALTLYPDVANIVFGIGAHAENAVLQVLFVAAPALAVAILWSSYRRIARDERERMRWLLIGFVFGLLINGIAATLIFSTFIVAAPPAWLSIVLFSLNVLLPVAVAHAVIRHRVLDIDLVISRALVFALLTLLLAGAFNVLDWICGNVLESFAFARFLQAVLSIALAYALGRIQKLTVATVEKLVFRKRRAAHARLEQLVLALALAPAATAIEDALVHEAIAALELDGAVLYRRRPDAGYVRIAATANVDGAVAAVSADDALVTALQARECSVDLDASSTRFISGPMRAKPFCLAMPMRASGSLAGFVLYGAHADGAAIDAEETAQLERLTDAADLAFERLDVQRLRAEVAQLRLELRARGG